MNDGGFYYTVAAGGSSPAGKTDDGGLRSYGSMTYAGLKSMIYAGVKRDDPRVKAAYEWVQKHYTLDENPGMGGTGLYYYYHTFAKALSAIGEDKLVDAEGKSHDWRAELAANSSRSKTPTAAGSTRRRGGWKVTRTSSPRTVCSACRTAKNRRNKGRLGGSRTVQSCQCRFNRLSAAALRRVPFFAFLRRSFLGASELVSVLLRRHLRADFLAPGDYLFV